jgi:peptide/nickel transport system substrate-binding protein
MKKNNFAKNKYLRLYNSLIISVLITLLILVESCKNASNENLQSKQIFHYNQPSGIYSLDPAFARDQAHIWVIQQLYNTLVSFNDSLQIIPSIAKSWEISEDNCTYTFNIRDDVYFHKDKCFKDSTRKLNAKDVVYSLQRLASDETASPGRWILNSVAIKNNKLWIESTSDTTVVIHLSKPFTSFLSILAMPYCSIIPREAIDEYGSEFSRHPIGTGPFVFKYWKKDVKLILAKNNNYFEKDSLGNSLPYLDGISISFIKDKQVAFMDFMLGKFDFISGIDPSFKDILFTKNGELKEEFKNKYILQKSLFLNTEYLGFLINEDSPFNNKELRQAISLGIDRVAMMRYLRNNLGYPSLQGFIPPILNPLDSNNKYLAYNPQKAKQLLIKSGYLDYQEKNKITLLTNDTYIDIAEYIQNQLTKIGLEIDIEVIPPATLRDLMYKGQADFFRGSWIADYPEAENYFAIFYSKNIPPNGPNYTRFSHPQYDKLYEQLLNTADESKYKIIKEMNEILIEEMPVVPLYYDVSIRLIQPYVQGLKPNKMNMLNLKEVKVKKTEMK